MGRWQMIKWKPFLARWSRELMKTKLARGMRPRATASDWLGFPPATKDEVQKLEQRLGVGLPPSYKSFLWTTNGWRRTTSFIDRIRPADEVDWFRVENENWMEAYSQDGSPLKDSEYYIYTDGVAHDDPAE